MTPCPGFDPAVGLFSATTAFVDCRIEALGRDGYLGLAASGSPVGLALTGLLTLAVALFGYRLLLGETPSLRNGVWLLVRIGLVLTLATQWPAYQTLIYRGATAGPAGLAQAAGLPSGLSDPGLVVRLQSVQTRLMTARPPADPAAPAAAADTAAPPSPLAGAARIYSVSGLIALIGLRLAMAVLLALGPLFALALLFDATRALFGAWLQTLAGAALSGIVLTATLVIEMSVLEPQLRAYATGLRSPQGLAGDITVMTLVFAGVLAVGPVLCFLAVGRLRLHGGPVLDQLASSAAALAGRAAEPLRVVDRPSAEPIARSRAQAVADAVAATVRREDGAAPGAVRAAAVAGRLTGPDGFRAAALGGASPRRIGRRSTASMTRRDAA